MSQESARRRRHRANGGGLALTPAGAQYDAARGVVSLRFDDCDPASYTVVYPELQSRSLTAGFAVVAQGALGLDYAGKLTTAQAMEMQGSGHEIMCHSLTHGSDPADTAAFLVETVDAAAVLRAKGFSIFSFVQPGTWVGASNRYNITSAAFYGSTEDLALRANFAAYEAYIGVNTSFSVTRALPCTGADRYGACYISSDAKSLADLKAAVEWAVLTGQGQEFLIHPALIGTTGLSLANFQAFLDYIVTWKNAGLLDVLTPSQQTCGTSYTGTKAAFRAAQTADTDTRVDQSNATGTYASTSTEIYASLWSAGRIFRWLAKWDLSSLSGKTCTSAYLFVITPRTQTPLGFTVYRILPANNGWTKAGACWNHQVGTTDWAGGHTGCGTSGTDHSATLLGASAAGAVSSKATYPIALDATEFAAMVANNAGMIFRGTDEATISAVTKGVASNYATDQTRVMRLVALYQ